MATKIQDALFPRDFTEINSQQFFLNNADKENITNSDFSNHKFTDINGYGVTFKHCSFNYSVFDRAYFRNARFVNCSFIGCLFINSILRGAYFENCNVKYTRFKDTLISSDSIMKSLPLEPSIRKELLQNLRINARSIGDEYGLKKYIREELKAEREHFRKAIEKKEDYYANKYKGLHNWINVRLKSIQLWLDFHVWGHGEHPVNLFKFVIILLTVFSLIIFFTSNRFSGTSSIQQIFLLLYHSFLTTICTFFSINKSYNIDVGLLLTCLLVISRYITLGLFVSMLFRSLSKR